MTGRLTGTSPVGAVGVSDGAVADWVSSQLQTDSCQRDAMQHCIAASLLASDCDVSCALWAGVVNEQLQDDGDPMDLHNNRQGTTCQRNSACQAVACCEQRLESGQLRTDGRCQ